MEPCTCTTSSVEPLVRIARRDLMASAALLARGEARYLVGLYYQVQEYRKRANLQSSSSEEQGEPGEMVGWTLDAFRTIERNIKSAMEGYARSKPAGVWAMAQYGIGPVIVGGLLAHVDIARAPAAGNLWAFAGLDPSKRWEKGQKRPWNARLKVLAWKIGESFLKFHNRDECFYGHYFAERWAIEKARNERGDFAETARATLEAKRFKPGPTREAYEAGRLPDGRILLRAQRWATKLFLAHFHHVLHESELGTPPPRPYVLAHSEHVHYVAPPGWPL